MSFLQQRILHHFHDRLHYEARHFRALLDFNTMIYDYCLGFKPGAPPAGVATHGLFGVSSNLFKFENRALAECLSLKRKNAARVCVMDTIMHPQAFKRNLPGQASVSYLTLDLAMGPARVARERAAAAATAAAAAVEEAAAAPAVATAEGVGGGGDGDGDGVAHGASSTSSATAAATRRGARQRAVVEGGGGGGGSGGEEAGGGGRGTRLVLSRDLPPQAPPPTVAAIVATAARDPAAFAQRFTERHTLPDLRGAPGFLGYAVNLVQVRRAFEAASCALALVLYNSISPKKRPAFLAGCG